MAVRETEQAVQKVNIEPVVAAQIVSERTEKIKQAARKDRATKELDKEKVGKETKKLISPKATANFAKALQFVQKVVGGRPPLLVKLRDGGDPEGEPEARTHDPRHGQQPGKPHQAKNGHQADRSGLEEVQLDRQ